MASRLRIGPARRRWRCQSDLGTPISWFGRPLCGRATWPGVAMRVAINVLMSTRSYAYAIYPQSPSISNMTEKPTSFG
jgi:hypothetical protein